MIYTEQKASPDDAFDLADLRVESMRESLVAIGRFDPERSRERFLSSFNPDRTIKICDGLLLAGFYATEIFELERRTVEKPDDVEAGTHLGHLYFDANNYDKAILAYNKSLEFKPDNADVLTDLGIMYRRSGHPEDAISAFDRAIKVDPHHETSLFNKGIVLMHDLNDKEGAIKAWEKLVSINPNAQTPTGQSVRELIKKVR